MSLEPSVIEHEIEDMEIEFKRVENQKRLLEKEISKREAMGLDSSEYIDRLKEVSKVYDKLKSDIPRKKVELSEVKSDIAKANRKIALLEYINNRLEYYGEALKLVNGKKGKKVIKIAESSFEGDIGQYMRISGK